MVVVELRPVVVRVGHLLLIIMGESKEEPLLSIYGLSLLLVFNWFDLVKGRPSNKSQPLVLVWCFRTRGFLKRCRLTFDDLMLSICIPQFSFLTYSNSVPRISFFFLLKQLHLVLLLTSW